MAYQLPQDTPVSAWQIRIVQRWIFVSMQQFISFASELDFGHSSCVASDIYQAIHSAAEYLVDV